MFRDLGLRSAIRRVGSSESKPFTVGFDSTGMAKTNASTKVNASVCANEVDSPGYTVLIAFTVLFTEYDAM